jgi:hypothetical protein
MITSSRSTILLNFGSRSALEENEEPELRRITTISKSTEELGLTEGGRKAFEDVE